MSLDDSTLIHIFSFITPGDHTLDSVRKTKICLITMAPTNKLIFNALLPRIARLSKLEKIIAKYVIDSSDPLYLINALSIGIGEPITYINFNDAVEADIKTLLSIYPPTLNY